ncbi:MAG: DUF1330 domain-containing protein [Promethearchaeota archaeon]
MTAIKVNEDQFKELERNPNDQPFTMLNLLKFKPDTGLQSYLQYAKLSQKHIEKIGAEVVYLGKTTELLNGEETWDMILLVKYPSRKAFLKMAKDPEYIKVHELREEALERAVLYSTDPVQFRDMKEI